MDFYVAAIRSQNPLGFGGCIFSARPAQLEEVTPLGTDGHYVIRARPGVLGGAMVEVGQHWHVEGTEAPRRLELNGIIRIERQIEASRLTLLRPSGQNIISYLAHGTVFAGIGEVKARRLWLRFGEDIYRLLDDSDVDCIASLVGRKLAEQLVKSWHAEGVGRIVQRLLSHGLDPTLAQKAVAFYGDDASRMLEEDPYRLLSFCGSWQAVDTLARSFYRVQYDDPRRLQGAIEEACYRSLSTGHTLLSRNKLLDALQGVLGPQRGVNQWRLLIQKALRLGCESGIFIERAEGIQTLGAMVMERQVAQAVALRCVTEVSPLLSEGQLENLVGMEEAAEGVPLSAAQREAIRLAVGSRLLLITGGAGVGKTTVLKALYKAYDSAGTTVIQLALAGRAAKRMQEATGRPASTIARYLVQQNSMLEPSPGVVVIDEASMVDIITMSRVCEKLAPSTRLVLVGDPSQLMPVGPGLVLHVLANMDEIPQVKLTEVKRHGGELAGVAASIRCGVWPSLTSDRSQPVSFIPLNTAPVVRAGLTGVQEVIRELYLEEPDATQILCVRKNSVDGTKMLNALCQSALTSANAPIKVWSEERSCVLDTDFRVGDSVICIRNRTADGLQNGSMGRVVAAGVEGRVIGDMGVRAKSTSTGWIEWDDGVRRSFTIDLLKDLELAYAITVHKAQGSQWPKVIVPISGSRLLDRTLVYTAVSRAQHQVILVGDEQAARIAVEALPRASYRQVGLHLAVRSSLVEERERGAASAIGGSMV